MKWDLSIVVVATTQPNAYDKGVDENSLLVMQLLQNEQ